MDKLAKGLGKAKKILILGADKELISDLSYYFVEQGLKASCLYIPDIEMLEECDIVIIQILWDDEQVYVSPSDGPNLLIESKNLSREHIMDQVIGFLETIKF